MQSHRRAANRMHPTNRAEPLVRGIPQRIWLIRDALLVSAGVSGFVLTVQLLLSGRRVAAGTVTNWLTLAMAVTGGLLLCCARVGPATERRFRLTLAVGILLTGVPQALALSGWFRDQQYWPIGNACTAVGVVLVLFGVLDRVRMLQALTSLRTVLDALLLALASTTALWSVVFRQISVRDAPLTPGLLVSQFVVGLAVLIITRPRDPGLMVAAVGAAAIMVAQSADAWISLALQQPGWAYPLVSGLAWPVLIIGLLRSTARASTTLHSTDAGDEHRTSVTVTTFALVAAAMTAWACRVRGVDDETVWLATGYFVLLWVRELIRARQFRCLMREFSRQSREDALTGLPNLRALDERLLSIAAKPPTGELSVITIDLTRFKDVNDLFGRNVADQLLRALAGQLDTAASRQQGQTYRVGGDEFVVISQRPAALARCFATGVNDLAMTAAAEVPGLVRVPVRTAVGLAHLGVTTPTNIDDLRLLVSRSAQAMRHAKLTRRRLAVFEDALAQTQRRRFLIEEALRTGADPSWSVTVHFQPIYSLLSSDLVGVEALSRLHHPILGQICPTEFIRVAEEQGLIEGLGQQILAQALCGASRSGLFKAGKTLAVNVSALQLRSPHFVPELCVALEEAGVASAQVVIEITESVFIRPDDPGIGSLSQLHERGIRVVLDDFGTGYSSLSYLTRLPVAGLKLDKSLTQDLDNVKTHAIASSIAAMATELGLDVVVEGVETGAHEEHVRQLGFDQVQGWRYSRAVDEDALAALVRAVTLPLPVRAATA